MSNHFLSNTFCSQHFASNHFTGVKKPAPVVPVATGVQSLGGGVGWLPVEKHHECETEEQFDQYCIRRALGSKYTQKKSVEFAKKLGSKMVEDTKEAVDAVRTKERKKSADKVDKLRRRIRKYKTEINQLNKKLRGRNDKYRQEIEDLRATVERLESVVEGLKEALRASPVKVRHREKIKVRKPETKKVVSIEELMGDLEDGIAKALERADSRRVVRVAEDPVGDIINRLIWAAGIYAATEILIPEDQEALRLAGRGTAAMVAVSALAKIPGSSNTVSKEKGDSAS